MKLNVSSIADLNSVIQDNHIQMVDVKFTDLFGQWHHFTMPVEEFDADDAVNEGLGFDGSSIRGFQSIENSDMVLRLDPSTAIIDSVCAMPTLSAICNVHDPLSGAAYSRDPRNVAGKAVSYVESDGIADTIFVGRKPNSSSLTVSPMSRAAIRPDTTWTVWKRHGIPVSWG